MRQMLTEAYCYEGHEIENAAYARARAPKADHWFCPECYIPLTPAISTRKKCFYRALRGGFHEDACPHITEVTHSGPGQPPVRVVAAPPPVFPDILGIAPSVIRRVYNPNAPLNLPQLIAGAPRARRYGSLEQIVDSWNEMTAGERAAHRLQVGSYASFYDRVFVDLSAGKTIPAAASWPERIYRVTARVTAGNISPIYFATSSAKFNDPSGAFSLTMRIRADQALENEKPGIQTHLLGLRSAVLFWNGAAPLLSVRPGFTCFALAGGGNAPADNFAIR